MKKILFLAALLLVPMAINAGRDKKPTNDLQSQQEQQSQIINIKCPACARYFPAKIAFSIVNCPSCKHSILINTKSGRVSKLEDAGLNN